MSAGSITSTGQISLVLVNLSLRVDFNRLDSEFNNFIMTDAWQDARYNYSTFTLHLVTYRMHCMPKTPPAFLRRSVFGNTHSTLTINFATIGMTRSVSVKTPYWKVKEEVFRRTRTSPAHLIAPIMWTAEPFPRSRTHCSAIRCADQQPDAHNCTTAKQNIAVLSIRFMRCANDQEIYPQRCYVLSMKMFLNFDKLNHSTFLI